MAESKQDAAGAEHADAPDRRTFLGAAGALAMTGGLVASYGTFFAYGGRFLYPAERTGPKGWMFVTDVAGMAPGAAIQYRTPAGATVVIARQGRGETAADFLALSSTCPHLGCQVRWEAGNHRFFCPCHNGVFDESGRGVEGPPEGQSLLRYPLKVERGLLYIEVALTRLAASGERDGHDSCLGPPGAV